MITAALHEQTTAPETEAMIRDLLAMLETNGLEMRRRGDRVLRYVVHRDGGQAVNQDRELVLAWATRWTNVGNVSVSDLIDLDQAA